MKSCGRNAGKPGRVNNWGDTRMVGCLLLAVMVVVSVESAAKIGAIGWYEIRAATLQAFASYVANTDAENAKSLKTGNFLWVDDLDQEKKRAAYERLKQGEVELRRLSSTENAGIGNVPGGMIHDWEGLEFIPGVKLDAVLKVLEDYGQHAIYYAPDVEKSRIESHSGDHYLVYLRFRRQKVVTVVLNTEHEVNYFRDSPTRAHSRSSAIRIAQVENPGSAGEKEKVPGEDDGFLWRMETWWRLEERDGGVYLQNEVVTLTRDIPGGLAWLIEPFITKIPKETLEFTLRATRKAVLEKNRR